MEKFDYTVLRCIFSNFDLHDQVNASQVNKLWRKVVKSMERNYTYMMQIKPEPIRSENVNVDCGGMKFIVKFPTDYGESSNPEKNVISCSKFRRFLMTHGRRVAGLDVFEKTYRYGTNHDYTYGYNPDYVYAKIYPEFLSIFVDECPNFTSILLSYVHLEDGSLTKLNAANLGKQLTNLCLKNVYWKNGNDYQNFWLQPPLLENVSINIGIYTSEVLSCLPSSLQQLRVHVRPNEVLHADTSANPKFKYGIEACQKITMILQLGSPDDDYPMYNALHDIFPNANVTILEIQLYHSAESIDPIFNLLVDLKNTLKELKISTYRHRNIGINNHQFSIIAGCLEKCQNMTKLIFDHVLADVTNFNPLILPRLLEFFGICDARHLSVQSLELFATNLFSLRDIIVINCPMINLAVLQQIFPLCRFEMIDINKLMFAKCCICD